MPDYHQADLDQARELVADLTSKQYERIARALSARERKGAAEARVGEQERDELFWQRLAALTGAEVTGG